MKFAAHIGIDYSGAQTAESRLAALQVFAAAGASPRRVSPPAASAARRRNWTRREIAEWLVEQAEGERPFIAGIDHGFSFPLSYFRRYRLSTWDGFLVDLARHWPTDAPHTHVDSVRTGESGMQRRGDGSELRLTERWASSAKSVFQFDVQGSVAKATHAGLPWLLRIRRQVGDGVHFWPFDGWQFPEGKSVIAEVFPSLFRKRYPRDDRSADEQDAYATARWLRETDERGEWQRYCLPPLTDPERKIAEREGWILGIS